MHGPAEAGGGGEDGQAVSCLRQRGAPFQPALAAALALPDSFYADLARSLQHKRDLLSDGLPGRPGSPCSRPPAPTSWSRNWTARYGDRADFCRSLPAQTGWRPCRFGVLPGSGVWAGRWCGSPSVERLTAVRLEGASRYDDGATKPIGLRRKINVRETTKAHDRPRRTRREAHPSRTLSTRPSSTE